MSGLLRGLRLSGDSGFHGLPPNIDWLTVAFAIIANDEGVKRLCAEFKVEKQTIYNWLEKGVGGLPFNRVIEIHRKSGVALENLAKRTGPFNRQADRDTARN